MQLRRLQGMLTDKEVLDYIGKYGFHDNIRNNHHADFFYWLSDLRKALLCWYPLEKAWSVLEIGGQLGTLTEYIANRVQAVDTVEENPVFRSLIAERMQAADNVQVLGQIPSSGQYDCILVIDSIDVHGYDLQSLFCTLRPLLKDDGVLLVGFHNRYGMKYLCGRTDPYVSVPFGIFDDRTVLHTKQETDYCAAENGFPHVLHYYPLPNQMFVQAVFSDERLPEQPVHDRVFPFEPFGTKGIIPEREMLKQVTEDRMLDVFSDYILAEYRKTERPASVYPVSAYLSADRGKEHSFSVIFRSDHTVLKQPVYKEGQQALEMMYRNLEELRRRGLLIAEQALTAEGILMQEYTEETLLAYMERLIKEQDAEQLLALFDLLYSNVLRSSSLDEEGRLKKAYIDMIPYNGFWIGEDIRYYDQEFSREDCPPAYVQFRAVFYSCIHFPDLEKVLPASFLKKRYGLEDRWDEYMDTENCFVSGNRNYTVYGQIYDWAKEQPL